MPDIIVPGEQVAQGMQRLAYTYTDGQNTYATVISLRSAEDKIIPLAGPYEPVESDTVVGFVVDTRHSGYDISMGSANRCFLSSRETRTSFRLSDIVVAKIKSIDETGTIDLTDARALKDGQLASISAVKVPRLIGKKNSMIGLISNATGCLIYVGRNGIVFISNEGDFTLARQAIQKVENEAHVPGLTDRMTQFLCEKTGKDPLELSNMQNENNSYDALHAQDAPHERSDGFSRGPRRHSSGFSRRPNMRR